MHPVIDRHRDSIADLCRRYHVQRLDVFGSASTGAFDPQNSDVDFLVEFEDPMPIRRFHAYFDLKHDLEGLLGRSVDLVEPGGIRNDIYRRGIRATQQPLYAA